MSVRADPQLNDSLAFPVRIPPFLRTTGSSATGETGKKPCALLLDLLRTGDREDVSGKLAQLDGTSWNELILDADKHRVTSLLYWRLKDTEPAGKVSVDAMARLRHAYYAEATRAVLRRHALSRPLAVLREAGVPVIVLKGTYLAEAVYPNIALRSTSDVDLLVPRTKLQRAQAILLDMGYGPKEREDIELLCRRSKHLAPFVGEDSSVELHWSIANPTGPLGIDIAGLWQRAQPATIAGVEVLALSPEDLLLHLCLHASREHRLVCRLRPFCDIAEDVRHYGSGLDWSQFVDRAREWGASRYAGLTLHLARNLLEVPVPDDVLERLVPGGLDPKVFEAARETVITGTPYDKWLSPAFLGLRGREPLTHKVKLLWERVFLSRDAMLAEYPASRDSRHPYIYHARRLWDIIRKWGPALRMMPSHKWERSLSGNALLADWLRSSRP